MTFKIDKVVGALPGTLTPNTVYAVRTGVGFDLYITDSTGTTAHKINKQPATESDVSAALGNNPMAYVQSRGLNLVTNGTGLLGTNYNFSPFTFDPAEAYSASGSFRITSKSITARSTEAIPVDASAAYELSAVLKWQGDQQPNMFITISQYDNDGLEILTRMHYQHPGTRTTLAQPLKPGDTQVHLTNSSGWYNSTNGLWKVLGIYGYKNSGGYTYPGHSYTRNIVLDGWDAGGIDFVNHVITLKTPFPLINGNPAAADKAWPIGHPIANNRDGGTFKYFTSAVNSPTPANWGRFGGVISGTDLSGGAVSNMFSPGVAFIKLVFLLNRDTVNPQTTWVSNVDFKLFPTFQKLAVGSENRTPATTLAVEGNIGPYVDGAGNCGIASRRWADVYAVSGTINTSDARLKTPVRPFNAAEIAAACELSREIGIFQWLSAIDAKGADVARQHVGVTVQRVIEIMTGHGLDPFRYGIVCFDAWPEKVVDIPAETVDNEYGTQTEVAPARSEVLEPAGDVYSLRYDQLMAFSLRGLAERVSRLEVE